MMKFLRTQMKWIMAVIAVAFLLSTFLMYEGRGTRRTPGRNADGSISDYEVAQINGRSLMRSELEQRLRNYLSNYRSRSVESLDMPTIYQTVLDQAVLESQLNKEVEEHGIRISDAEADQAMKSYADRYYPTRETFYQALEQSGIKVDDYRRMLARQMATEQLIQNAIGAITISEDRAVEFYDTMKNLIYSKPEGFMVHMANFNDNAAAETMREKLSGGESWTAIVSSDELASKDIINITREPVFLPLSAFRTGVLGVLSSLDVGQVSPVFSVSSFDFAIGLKTEHVDSSLTPYIEVSADIKTLLTQQEERRRLTEYEASLRNKAQLVINDESLFARPVVSEDNTPSFTIEEVPETVSEDVTAPAPQEEVAVVEESTPEPEAPVTEPEVSEVTEEVPAVVEETVTEPEAPADIEETVSEPEAPEVIDSHATEPEPSVNVDEATSSPEVPVKSEEVPAVAEETVTEPEVPADIEETVSEPEAPEVIDSHATEPEPSVNVDEATSKPEVPVKSEEVPAVAEETVTELEAPANIEEIVSEPEAPEVTEEPTRSEATPTMEEDVSEKIIEAVSELVEKVEEAAE